MGPLVTYAVLSKFRGLDLAVDLLRIFFRRKVVVVGTCDFKM